MDESGQPKASKPLREAVRSARLEAAERSAVIVELRDAEAARLSILDDALESVFSEIPAEHLDLFDRGIAMGTQPRLWIDMIAHVAMGRDKRTYRFLQDTAHGRRVLAESLEVEPIAKAITVYVARRLVAREQMLAGTAPAPIMPAMPAMPAARPLETVIAPSDASLRPFGFSQRSADPWFMLFAGLAIGIGLMLALFSLR